MRQEPPPGGARQRVPSSTVVTPRTLEKSGSYAGGLCQNARSSRPESRQDKRGQWRVEEKMLEQYIEERYAEASRMIQESRSKSG